MSVNADSAASLEQVIERYNASTTTRTGFQILR